MNGPIGSAQAERTPGCLEKEVRGLHISLDSLADLTNSIHGFSTRLLEPRPTPPTGGVTGDKNTPQPSPSTLESSINMANRRLRDLNANLQEILTRLNSAC